MDPIKMGMLIRRLRLRKGFTQRALAEKIGVSDKAVSKWERGCGAPDPALLAPICDALDTDAEALLRGESRENRAANGNMRRCAFYVCPTCGNIALSTDGARVHCCGQRLAALKAQNADEAHALACEKNDGEWLIAGAHPMTREHFVAFAALLTGDTAIVKRLYPEWNLEFRLPYQHGTLYWYCTQHGLYSQKL